MTEFKNLVLKLKLKRPVVCIDIEATGSAVFCDRIVEIAGVKLYPDGNKEVKVWRVNPERQISDEAMKIHHISNEDVKNCPKFKDIAREIYEFLKDCDLIGYNISRFDLPMLVEEFKRAGIEFETRYINVVDVQTIYHKKEPRDLCAAVEFYCGRKYNSAHNAVSDAEVTLEVLEGQLNRYSDLPKDLEELSKYTDKRRKDWVDRAGKFKWENGTIVINFGKRKGMPVLKVIEEDPNFVKWMMNSDFPAQTKEILKDIIEHRI